ncbi:Uncharacterised protein [Bordetella pertussis]|nr:Uncharacterised protein [Bordetella pertussis]
MDLPDCMDVCSFSTTSPSWIRSWLTLMPVISVKARASVLASYSCVVMVSDTTLISLTPLAFSFSAASMNHFISAICWSLDSDEGWNSLSTHFFASGSPAQAACVPIRAMAAAMACMRIFMTCLLDAPPLSLLRDAGPGKAGPLSW